LNNYQGKLGMNAVSTSQRNGATILSLAGINGNAKETLVVSLKPSVLAAGQTEITITHVKVAAQ
jgi:ABC-type Na+ transport system ATPase subunit NatA